MFIVAKFIVAYALSSRHNPCGTAAFGCRAAQVYRAAPSHGRAEYFRPIFNLGWFPILGGYRFWVAQRFQRCA